MISEDGSPHGPKCFVLWNPPLTHMDAKKVSVVHMTPWAKGSRIVRQSCSTIIAGSRTSQDLMRRPRTGATRQRRGASPAASWWTSRTRQGPSCVPASASPSALRSHFTVFMARTAPEVGRGHAWAANPGRAMRRCACCIPRRQAQAELHRIAAREANQARSGASQINPAAGFTAADMLAAAKVCVWVVHWLLLRRQWLQGSRKAGRVGSLSQAPDAAIYSAQVGRRRGEVDKEVADVLRYVVSPFTKEEVARRRQVSRTYAEDANQNYAACPKIMHR